MRTEAKELFERLGIEYSDEQLPYYERGKRAYEREGRAIFDPERLRRINKKYNIFRDVFEHIIEVGERLSKDDDMVLYNYIAKEAIADRIPFNKLFSLPDSKCERSDHSATYAILAHLERAIGLLEARDLPREVISDSLNGIESEIKAYHEYHGRYGTRGLVGWYTLFLNGEILRIGRLQYQFFKLTHPVRIFKKGDDTAVLMDGVEMHKKGLIFGAAGQTDEEGKFFADIKEENGTVTGYRSNKYGEVDTEPVTLVGYDEPIKRGANILSLHITNSEPFTYDLVIDSLKRADEFFPKYYKDLNIQAYYVHSWLLEKRLRDIVGKETNITRFADLFTGIPTKAGQGGVFTYLFGCTAATPIEEYPENTSMQRAVKKYMAEGGYFYDKVGIRLI